MFKHLSRLVSTFVALAGLMAGAQPLLAAPNAPMAPDAQSLVPAEGAIATPVLPTLRRLHGAPRAAAAEQDAQRQDLDRRLEALTVAAEQAGPGSTSVGKGSVDGIRRQGVFDFGHGPQAVTVVERNGMAFFEGDTVLGPIEQVVRGAAAAEGATDGAMAADRAAEGTDSLILRGAQWPGGRMVYEIDQRAFPQGSERREMVDAAIHAWNTQTLVRLVPRDSSNWREHFVSIDAQESGQCYANLGYWPNKGGFQRVNLGEGCDLAAAVHEIGHSVGLAHEQSRSDRDAHINVNLWNVVDPDQYLKHTEDPTAQLMDWGPYDLQSVMHYDSLSPAIDRRYPAANRRECHYLDMSPSCLIGRNARLTTYDKAGVTRIVTGDPQKFRLQGDVEGRCLAVIGGSFEDGVPIVDADCRNEAAQRWYSYEDGAEGLLIINEGSRLCVTATGDHLLQRPCTGISEQRFTLSGDSDEPTELPAIQPCDVVGQRSVWGGQASKITFINQRSDWVFIYWVDGNGGYHHYYSLEAGDSYLQETYGGHLWVAVDRNGYILAGYRATDEDARAVVR